MVPSASRRWRQGNCPFSHRGITDGTGTGRRGGSVLESDEAAGPVTKTSQHAALPEAVEAQPVRIGFNPPENKMIQQIDVHRPRRFPQLPCDLDIRGAG